MPNQGGDFHGFLDAKAITNSIECGIADFVLAQ
jgi:hypothetical protein